VRSEEIVHRAQSLKVDGRDAKGVRRSQGGFKARRKAREFGNCVSSSTRASVAVI